MLAAGDDESLARTGVSTLFPDLHGGSHGESFIDIALTRLRSAGFYILDEPESALSVIGQLRLLRIMHDACAAGAQFVIGTHCCLRRILA